MVVQTYQLLLNAPTNNSFLFFVLFSTLCSYSFHWHLTSHSVIPSRRMDWLNTYRIAHTILFFIGLIGAGIFFFQLLPYWHWLVFSAIVTFLYSAPKIPHPLFRALRRVAYGKTIFLAFVWVYVTTILPILISEQPWKISFFYFIISRFFLVYAICVLFDYRDREDDKAAGIRSLITYLDQSRILYLFAASLVVFAAATLLLLTTGYSVFVVLTLLLPGIITAALFKYSQRNFSDVFYYFVLDGLMALSPIITLISGI